LRFVGSIIFDDPYTPEIITSVMTSEMMYAVAVPVGRMNVENWTIEDVSKWLTDFGMEVYKDVFKG